MLNEAPRKRPKKEVDYAHPTRFQLFYRTQWECFRRAFIPYMMYLFMSLLCLACQLIGSDAAAITLGIACIIGGACYNANLLYAFGKMHYGNFVAGELNRKSEEEGLNASTSHRVEREYRPWKGFLIGFYTALPAIVFSIVAGALTGKWAASASDIVYVLFVMLAGWAIIPISWFGKTEDFAFVASPYYALIICILPIVVSGIAYIIGALRERSDRLKSAEKTAVERGGKKKAKK